MTPVRRATAACPAPPTAAQHRGEAVRQHRSQGRFKVPLALRQSCADIGTTSGLHHPMRCQERVAPCA